MNMPKYVRFSKRPASRMFRWPTGRTPHSARCTASCRARDADTNGFAITADAYRHVLDSAGAWGRLRAALDGLDPSDVADLARRGKRAREAVYGAGLPEDVAGEVLAGYGRLQQ